MRSSQTYGFQRGAFCEALRQEGIPFSVSEKLLRLSNTLQHDAEGQCNGDYPHDNGERTTAACECGVYVAPEALKGCRYGKPGVKYCPGCRAELQVSALCEPLGIKPEFSGDPRGCVLKLRLPSGKADSFGGDGTFCVPAK